MNVDVLGVTEQGRQRLAEAMRPCWQHAWRWGGRSVAIAAWGIVALVIAAVIGGVLVAVLTGNTPRRGLLP
jgi:hypothetical protein